MAMAFELIKYFREIRARVVENVAKSLKEPPVDVALGGPLCYDQHRVFSNLGSMDRDSSVVAMADLVATDVLRTLLIAMEQRTRLSKGPSLSKDGARIAFVSDGPQGELGQDIDLCGAIDEFMECVEREALKHADPSLIQDAWKNSEA
jgi:hypothetical protein